MRKKFLFLFVCFFFALCMLPGLGTLFLGESQAAANEVLSPKPRAQKPDGSWNLSYFSDVTDYFSDHFAFRQELITVDSCLKAAVFHTSSQEQVALGKDGWLFYAETLDDYTGARLITEREAFCIARSLSLAQEYVKAHHGEFVFTIAPNKLSLYPQYYGDLERADVTSATRLAQALELEGVVYANLFQRFSQEEEVLYHKTDSHWTYKGAALAHDAVLEALGTSGQAFSKPGTYEKNHQGDLSVMLYPASPVIEDQFRFSEEPQFTYVSPIRGPDDLRILTSSQGEKGNLLMFRDSFGNTLHTLMAESFGNALFSRAMPYNLGFMKELPADHVVVEIVERNVGLLAENPFEMPSPSRSLEEISGLRQNAEASVSMTASANLPGYFCVSGQISDNCDTDSPIFLELAGKQYEAFPVGKGEGIPFAAYVSETGEQVRLYYRKGGEWAFVELNLPASVPVKE